MFILKNTMLAIALVAGISGAFATKIANSPKTDLPKYDWSGSGPLHSGTLDNKTVKEAQDYYSCSGSLIICATGTRSSGTGAPKAILFMTD